jgi:hypothetical protein
LGLAVSLATHLTALETFGLIRLAQIEPELEYLFRHALVQDAAYASILKADRKHLHLAIGETIERIYPDQLGELAPVLGRHFQLAEDYERAARYFAQAAERAMHGHAAAEAEQFYAAALELTPAQARPARIPLLDGLGGARHIQGRHHLAVEAWRTAAQLQDELGDYNAMALSYTRISRALYYAGELEGQISFLSEGLEYLKDKLATPGLSQLLRAIAMAYFFNGRAEPALDYARQALELAQRLNNPAGLASAYVAWGTVLPRSRSLEKQAALEQAAQLADQNNLRELYITARFNLADLLVNNFSALPEACAIYHELLADVRERHIVFAELWSTCDLVWALLLLGKCSEAADLIQRIAELLRVVPNPGQIVPAARFAEAAAARFQGDLISARRLAQNGLAFARRQKDWQSISWLTLLLGELELEQANCAAAEKDLLECIEAGDRGLGRQDVVPRCMLSLTYTRWNNLSEARRRLAEARARAPWPADAPWIAWAEAGLAQAEGRWAAALAAYQTAAQTRADLGQRWYRADTLRQWAAAHLARNAPGDIDRARDLLRAAQTEFQAMNVPQYAALSAEQLATLV